MIPNDVSENLRVETRVRIIRGDGTTIVDQQGAFDLCGIFSSSRLSRAQREFLQAWDLHVGTPVHEGFEAYQRHLWEQLKDREASEVETMDSDPLWGRVVMDLESEREDSDRFEVWRQSEHAGVPI